MGASAERASPQSGTPGGTRTAAASGSPTLAASDPAATAQPDLRSILSRREKPRDGTVLSRLGAVRATDAAAAEVDEQSRDAAPGERQSSPRQLDARFTEEASRSPQRELPQSELPPQDPDASSHAPDDGRVESEQAPVRDGEQNAASKGDSPASPDPPSGRSNESRGREMCSPEQDTGKEKVRHTDRDSKWGRSPPPLPQSPDSMPNSVEGPSGIRKCVASEDREPDVESLANAVMPVTSPVEKEGKRSASDRDIVNKGSHHRGDGPGREDGAPLSPARGTPDRSDDLHDSRRKRRRERSGSETDESRERRRRRRRRRRRDSDVEDERDYRRRDDSEYDDDREYRRRRRRRRRRSYSRSPPRRSRSEEEERQQRREARRARRRERELRELEREERKRSGKRQRGAEEADGADEPTLGDDGLEPRRETNIGGDREPRRSRDHDEPRGRRKRRRHRDNEQRGDDRHVDDDFYHERSHDHRRHRDNRYREDRAEPLRDDDDTRGRHRRGAEGHRERMRYPEKGMRVEEHPRRDRREQHSPVRSHGQGGLSKRQQTPSSPHHGFGFRALTDGLSRPRSPVGPSGSHGQYEGRKHRSDLASATFEERSSRRGGHREGRDRVDRYSQQRPSREDNGRQSSAVQRGRGVERASDSAVHDTPWDSRPQEQQDAVPDQAPVKEPRGKLKLGLLRLKVLDSMKRPTAKNDASKTIRDPKR